MGDVSFVWRPTATLAGLTLGVWLNSLGAFDPAVQGCI
jgi:hypothetical protein